MLLEGSVESIWKQNVLSYLLCGTGDDALLKAVGLLLKVLSSLMIPEQIVFYLEIKHVSLKNTFRLSRE